MRLPVLLLALFSIGCDGATSSPAATVPTAAPAATVPTAAPAAPATAPAPAPRPPGAFVCCDAPNAAAVVAAYLDAQAALAKDDDAKAATDLAALVSRVTAAEADPALDAESKALLATLRTEADAAHTATSIDARRASFKKASTPAIAFARQHVGGERSVSEAWCPMAEAGWLQEGGTIQNPYYGSQMLTCGSFR